MRGLDVHRTALAALTLGAASCGQLLGIEPWDPEVSGAGGDATSGGALTSGSPVSGSGSSAGGASVGSTGETSSASTESSAGGSGDGGSGNGGDGGSSSGSSGGGGDAASSSAAGPCGGLDQCMGECLDCLGGACTPGATRCEPVLLGTADAPGAEAYVAIGTTAIWYGRGAKFFTLPLGGPVGDAPLAAQVAGTVSGLATIGADAVGAHTGGILRLSADDGPTSLFTAPAATVSGVAVGDGKVWFGGDWSGVDGIYGIDDAVPTLGTISAQCTNPSGIPRAVAYVAHDLYLATVNQSSIGGGFYHCTDDAPGTTMEGTNLGLSVRRIARTSFGDFAAAVFHEVVPRLATFDDTAIEDAIPLLDVTDVYDVAGGDDVVFFTLAQPEGSLGVDGVYMLALPGGDLRDVVRVASCTGACQAVAVDGTRLAYSQADGGVWALQLEGTPFQR